MRLAMAQMSMSESADENLQKTLELMERAKDGGADMIFFPELQLSPFFPQYKGRDASRWLLTAESAAVKAICRCSRSLGLWVSPNIYLEANGKRYDASLMIDADGEIKGVSKMVYVADAPHFYERGYYTPSDEGFRVYATPFGSVGVVICFDRHIPLSIRACAVQGAELVLIPTANISSEPSELFEWEVRVQAYQNAVFAAMCNRVGTEGEVTFAGQSLIAEPDGGLLFRAGQKERLCIADISLERAREAWRQRPWLALLGEEKRAEGK